MRSKASGVKELRGQVGEVGEVGGAGSMRWLSAKLLIIG